MYNTFHTDLPSSGFWLVAVSKHNNSSDAGDDHDNNYIPIFLRLRAALSVFGPLLSTKAPARSAAIRSIDWDGSATHRESLPNSVVFVRNNALPLFDGSSPAS